MSEKIRQKPKLLEQVRNELRLRQRSYSTEKTYVSWITRYIRFHNYTHPKDMGREGVSAFLTYLAAERDVSAATQNQAFSALLFLYREVLGIRLENINALRARKPRRLPRSLDYEGGPRSAWRDGGFQLVGSKPAVWVGSSIAGGLEHQGSRS